MMEQISHFIASKSLSENSRKSYYYDLQQFCRLVNGQLSSSKLRLYEQSLAGLKVSARKRKLSAVNQFLLYLYEEGQIETYYRLKNREKRRPQPTKQELLDLSEFYQTEASSGKWLALLMLELGLSPNEIAGLKVSDCDVDFEVVRINKGEQVRVIPLPMGLLPLFENVAGQTYLFDHKGQPYSRQWFFNQLNRFLADTGHPDLTAQKLREQYILREVAQGTSLLDLTKKLGLKTSLTLERYYRNGY
ncbi:site-specific tyrosine recombinase XerD [Streptococcus dentasini]